MNDFMKTPPPGVEPTVEETWPEPIDLFGDFEPPLFPEHVLVPHVREWADFQSASTGGDKAGYIMSALTACSAVIPDHVRLCLNEHTDWFKSPRMWTALVGPPSAKKSPILKTAMGPVVEINDRYRKDAEAAQEEYEKLSDKDRKERGEPVKRRLIIEDVTVEATQHLFKNNPGGLLLLQDELAGFFGAIDKYNDRKGGNADRAYWLKAFNGQPYSVDRVKRGDIYIPHLSASMLGGIQPEPLREIASGLVDDGLIQRLFTIVLRKASPRRNTAGMESRRGEYREMLERLHYKSEPKTHTLSIPAGKLFRDAEAEYEDMQFGLENLNRKMATHIGKFAGMLARLALTLHYMENAEPPLMIGEDTLRRAKWIMDMFLLPQSYSFYSRILEEIDPQLIQIAGYILAHPDKKELTVRETVRGRKGVTAQEGQRIFERLVSVGWVREVEPAPGAKVTRWEPNPKVHQYFAEIAKQEAERRQKAHKILVSLGKSCAK